MVEKRQSQTFSEKPAHIPDQLESCSVQLKPSSLAHLSWHHFHDIYVLLLIYEHLKKLVSLIQCQILMVILVTGKHSIPLISDTLVTGLGYPGEHILPELALHQLIRLHKSLFPLSHLLQVPWKWGMIIIFLDSHFGQKS